MKIICLLNEVPSLRYQAQLAALSDSGADLEFVQLSRSSLVKQKILHHLNLLRKKGLGGYYSWMKSRKSGGEIRRRIAEEYTSRIIDGEIRRLVPTPSRTFNGFDEQLLRFIDERRPDFLFQADVGIVPHSFIEKTPPMLNLHPGILPGIRGVDPVFWAHYYAKEQWLGSTIHYISEKLDQGKPLLRLHFPRRPNGSYIDSLFSSLRCDQDLLRLWATTPVSEYHRVDEGGNSASIYRSTFSADQFHRLEAANWWRAEDLAEAA